MCSKDHASIDIELADSLSGKLKTLHYCASSKERCIYRVLQPRRCLNSSDYTPKIVSIGPLHYGKEELKAMEDNKLTYLHHFLQQTKVSMSQFVACIREKEAKLRSCYAEIIHLESDAFVTMILVDAVFLIEFFLRCYMPYFRTDNDPLFGEEGMSYLGLQMRYDLYLAENQIPLFILSDLFDLAKKETNDNISERVSLRTLTLSYFSREIGLLPIDEMNLIDTQFSAAKHFLDLIILCLQSSQLHNQSECNYRSIPRITELHQAGVKFESRSRGSQLDIKFNNGVMRIPLFEEHGFTQCLYRNLIAFEIMHGYPNYFGDYIVVLSYLIRTPKDAEFLIQNEVIDITDSERFPAALQSLRKDTLWLQYFHYADVVKDVQAFYKSPWHKWKANLKQNYFNTPWASISVIAAVILLLLTVTQAVCSIIAL